MVSVSAWQTRPCVDLLIMEDHEACSADTAKIVADSETHGASFLFPKQGRGEGPRTLAVRASQRFVYRELTERVIIVIVKPSVQTVAQFALVTNTCVTAKRLVCLRTLAHAAGSFI